MSGINVTRVLIGGIVAGLVVNVSEFVLNMFVVKAQMDAAVARMNLPPVGGQAIGTFVILGFALGIAAIWLYAAIRPRLGAGVNTALCAGALVWFFAYLYPGIGMWTMGMWPWDAAVISLGWGLAELLAGTVAGASLYREEAAAAAAPV
jgi:hypothetical protein